VSERTRKGSFWLQVSFVLFPALRESTFRRKILLLQKILAT
jgi:hypothetical protein